MKLELKVFENNIQVNTLNYEKEDAYIKLVNVLFDKIDKRYKITIKKDTTDKTIKIILYFENAHKKYKYEYNFTNVDTFINLF